MACPDCNAHTPNYLQLCDGCIKRRNSSRGVMPTHTRSTNLATVSLQPDEHTLRSVLVWALGGIAIFSILTVVFLLTGPVKSEGPNAAFAFAFTAGLAFIVFATYSLFWSRIIVMEPLWAILCLFIPCLVWKYVRDNWNDLHVRKLAIAHFAAIFLGFFSNAWLANAVGLSYLETRVVFESYVHGENIDVTKYKNGEYDYADEDSSIAYASEDYEDTIAEYDEYLLEQ